MAIRLVQYVIVSVFVIFLSGEKCFAQETDNVTSTIRKLDIEFWEAYNRCDVPNMSKFFTDDFEFYHDKHGLTSTKETMTRSIKDGLCSGREQVRREVIDGTVEIFPLKSYGAVISGDHLFYVSENGSKERLAEQAKFTHIWKQEGDVWKMSRVISYDHKSPTPEIGKSHGKD